MKFIKYQACGNDYVYVDCFEQNIDDPCELSKKISNRHFGVGSDGLILILPSKISDAKMRIFNSDGSEGDICGNGLRCVSKFLCDEKNINKEFINIETNVGIKRTKVVSRQKNESQIEVNMGEPKFLKKIELNMEDLDSNFGSYISMGNPHFVIFCDEISKLDIESIGRKIQIIDYFKGGVNVEFVRINSRSSIDMRVYERGSGETLSCGSGACASSFSAIYNNFCNNIVSVNLPGGTIKIEYKNDQIYMTGSAIKVFSGEFYL